MKDKEEKKKKNKKEKRPRKDTRLRRAFTRLSQHRVFGSDLFVSTVLSFVVLIFIESWGYKTPVGGFIFLIKHPGAFVVNWIIIFTTLSVARLFRRRIFVYTVISVVWAGLGIANGFILMKRMTPFTTADLQIFDLGVEMITVYLTPLQITLLAAAFAAVIATFVLLFLFAPKRQIKDGISVGKRLGREIIAIALSVLLLVGSWNFGIQTGVVSTYFKNLWDAYTDYGMPYSFLSTWLRQGVSRPYDYSKKKVDGVFKSGELSTMTSDEMTAEEVNKKFPNIVFLQLESFIDPTDVKGLKFSEEPVPFFKELKEKYSTGHLTVPVVGGGTANTEFEVISGMSAREFGPGEYPCKTILKKKSVETMAYDMTSLGYTAHAIHNHRGAFYNRNLVFKNLGFHDFTSLEYMNYVSKTQKNFATDDVLTGEILGALESTEGKDYIYTISVQGHGEYPSKKTIKNPRVTLENATSPAQKYSWEYYLEQISEMDDFLRALTEELNSYDEDVILIMYGDHLPALGMGDSDMKSGSIFNTEYVIWSNFVLPKLDGDINAYQLGADVQERVGLREGTMTVFHQDQIGKAGYQSNLHLLMYDMLYGKRYIFGGADPYPPTDMQMGYKPIIISEVIEVGGEYYISGEGFTPFSKVTLGDKILNTIYIDPTVLKLLDKVDPDDVSEMKVSQADKYKEILSTTE
jgi:phosphoglycerol transferase MdoB-like AlkP superfamily enzyme